MKLNDPYGYVGGLKVTSDGCRVKPTSAAKIPHHQSRIRFALDDATWQRLRGTCTHLPAATQAQRDHPFVPTTHPPTHPPTHLPTTRTRLYAPISCTCTRLPRRRLTYIWLTYIYTQAHLSEAEATEVWCARLQTAVDALAERFHSVCGPEP